MKNLTKVTVAAAAALALTLTACGGPGGSGTETPAPGAKELSTQFQINEQPRDALKDGGSLTTDLTEISPQFNTHQVDGTRYTLDVWRWYNPMLMLFAPDGTATPNPDYLSGYEKSEEGGKTVVKYTFNDKATFNDGTPIDWTSIEAAWKATSGNDDAYLASSTDGYSDIESVTKGDTDKVAVVTFKGIYAWVDGLFNNVLHPKVNTADLFNKAYVENPHAEWGAGPFTVDKYDKTSGTISFKRNDKWWGDPGKLESRTFKALEDSASINAFKAGQIDATSVGTKDRLAQVATMTDVDVRRSATPQQTLMVLNSKVGALTDANVRKAIFMGLDRKTIGDIAFQGLDYSEEPPGSFTLYPFQTGYVDNLAAAGYKFDVEGAKKLLEDNGWVAGSDGIREKDGKKLSFDFPVLGDSPNIIARSKAVNDMMKKIGVDAKIVSKPSTEFSNVFTKKEFGLFLMGFASSDPFGFAYFCQVWCSDSGLNGSGTGKPEWDTEIAALAKVGDPKAQIEQGNKLEAKFMGEAWGIMPLTNGPVIVATKKGLANYGAGLFFVGKVQDIGWQN